MLFEHITLLLREQGSNLQVTMHSGKTKGTTYGSNGLIACTSKGEFWIQYHLLENLVRWLGNIFMHSVG